MGRVVGWMGYGASFGLGRITDLVFPDDAVIFAEFMDMIVGVLETLSEEAEPLGLRVSWIKTKIQAFGDALDVAMESVSVNGERVEIVDSFTYLGSVIHASATCATEVSRCLGLACGVMSSLNKTV